MGRCQPGTLQSVCGKGGVMCGACAPGQACTQQLCGGPGAVGTGGGFVAGGGFPSGGGTAGGASGGAAAGGTAGGLGSSDGGCSTYPDIEAPDVFGEFTIGAPDSGLADFNWWTAEASLDSDTPTRFDFFKAELYFEKRAGPPTFPRAGTLRTGLTFELCEECFSASLGCNDEGGDCRADFLAVQGDYDFRAGTRSVDAGVFEGRGLNLTFRRWDFDRDEPLGTECFVVSEFSFRATWPDTSPDGGFDAGATDAGSGDAGLSDAGPRDAGGTDAGRDGG